MSLGRGSDESYRHDYPPQVGVGPKVYHLDIVFLAINNIPECYSFAFLFFSSIECV